MTSQAAGARHSHLTDGTVLFDLPLARVADNDGWRIRWSELYRILRQAAAPVIAYGCAIRSVTPSERDAEITSIAWTDSDEIKGLVGVPKQTPGT